VPWVPVTCRVPSAAAAPRVVLPAISYPVFLDVRR
jgi:hypothetical protein